MGEVWWEVRAVEGKAAGTVVTMSVTMSATFKRNRIFISLKTNETAVRGLAVAIAEAISTSSTSGTKAASHPVAASHAMTASHATPASTSHTEPRPCALFLALVILPCCASPSLTHVHLEHLALVDVGVE